MTKLFCKKVNSQKGFTLVELMIVIAIIGILAAIALPRFLESTYSANGAKLKADLRTIDSATNFIGLSVQFRSRQGQWKTTNHATAQKAIPSGANYGINSSGSCNLLSALTAADTAKTI